MKRIFQFRIFLLYYIIFIAALMTIMYCSSCYFLNIRMGLGAVVVMLAILIVIWLFSILSIFSIAQLLHWWYCSVFYLLVRLLQWVHCVIITHWVTHWVVITLLFNDLDGRYGWVADESSVTKRVSLCLLCLITSNIGIVQTDSFIVS